MALVLELSGIGVRFGVGPERLRDIALAPPPGSVTLITGPADAGKSMLLQVAALVLAPTRGEVRLFGEAVVPCSFGRRASLLRRIGWAPRAPALVPGHDAVTAVALPRRLAGSGAAEARYEAEAILRQLGGSTDESASARERQRIGVARAIAAAPALLLIDDADRLDGAALAGLGALLPPLIRGGTTVLLTATDLRFHPDLPVSARLGLRDGRVGVVDSAAANSLLPPGR